MHASAGRSSQAWALGQRGTAGLASHFCLCLPSFVKWHGKNPNKAARLLQKFLSDTEAAPLLPGELQRARSPQPSRSPCYGLISFPRQRKARGKQGTTGDASDVRKDRLEELNREALCQPVLSGRRGREGPPSCQVRKMGPQPMDRPSRSWMLHPTPFSKCSLNDELNFNPESL